jgi:type IV secretory pathway TrbD component
MKKKLAPFIENIAESGAACLVTMVQGNLLLLGLSHWVTASQTGLVAGTAAATAITLTRTDNRLILAGVLGVSTAIVDYFVHPGMIGEAPATEAIITGVGAAALSYVVSTILIKIRQRRVSAGAGKRGFH